jgi:hypothetical protein
MPIASTVSPVLSAGAHILALAERLPDAVVPVVEWNGYPRYHVSFFVTPLPVRKPQALPWVRG